tara:strand:+ start:1176 stop:1685 length:510 start_codon:yes stop_codon:yes gene_type:complete
MSSSIYNSSIGGDSSMFSRMKTFGGNVNLTTILIVCGIIILMSASIFYYFKDVSSQENATYNPNGEFGESENKNAELLFFYADWCPHCKSAKPIWAELQAEYKNKTINGYTIIFSEINCSEENAEVEKMMNKYSIEGYPTIKLLKDGQIIEYDAKPDKDSLDQFLNTVL